MLASGGVGNLSDPGMTISDILPIVQVDGVVHTKQSKQLHGTLE